MARHDGRKQHPFFLEKHDFLERHEMHTKAIADTPSLERVCMRGVFGVYVALGHVRTAASMLHVRAGVPFILRAGAHTCALSLDTEVAHDQPKSM